MSTGFVQTRRDILKAGLIVPIAVAGLFNAGAALAQAGAGIAPFTYRAPQDALDDLQQRLARTRWPERETVNDWSQGVPLSRMRALVDYWRDDYDWRRCEAALARIPQFRTTIDGLGIHFIHARSPHPNALPIVLTHGWPGSIVEFMEIVEPLTRPRIAAAPRTRFTSSRRRCRASAFRISRVRAAGTSTASPGHGAS